MKQWREITTIEQWKEVLDRSNEQPIVVLKHSTTCPVSANALHEFEEHLKQSPKGIADYVMVKVIESRPVSNQIAEDLSLKHESPQIILIEKEAKVWSATHWSVTNAHINAVLH